MERSPIIEDREQRQCHRYKVTQDTYFMYDLYGLIWYRKELTIFKGFQLITNKWTNYDFHK